MFAKRFPFSYLAFSILLLSAQMMFAQVTITSVFPSQNALGTSRDTQIMATFSNPIDLSSLNDTTVVVSGRQTGLHPGTIEYNTTTQTLTWTSETDFAVGEVVTVILTRHIKPQGAEDFKGFIWQFRIKVTKPTNAHFTLVETLDWPEKNGGMVLADLNRDQALDLILIGDVFGTLSVWFNDSIGNFEINGFYPVLEHMRHLSIGDFDRDNDLDLATPIDIGISSDPDPLLFFWNNSQGFFPDTTRMSTPIGVLAVSTIPNDLDADGMVDLIINDPNSEFTFVYKNLGKRQFIPHGQYNTGFASGAPILGDVDLDGDLDFIISVSGGTRADNNFKLLLNDGEGQFESIVVVDSILIARGLADFNADGNLDVIVQNSISDSLSVYVNNGGGEFIFTGKAKTGFDNWSYCIADFDGDGDLDIATAGERILSAMPVIYKGFVRFLMNDGNGNFTFSEDTVGTRTRYIDCGDIDNDGDVDIMLAEYGRPVHILLNDDKATSVADYINESPPAGFQLLQNYPNPFNSETTIEYTVPRSSTISIKIYDITGKEVMTLFRGNTLPGQHSVKWSGSNRIGKEVSSGVYIVVMKSPKTAQAIKILMLK